MSHFRSKGLSLLALAGLMAAQLPPFSVAQLPHVSAQDVSQSCIDRVAYGDPYALVKAANRLYVHRSIQDAASQSWETADDNAPWGGDSIADVDVALIRRADIIQVQYGTGTYTAQSKGTYHAGAIVAAGADVYAHRDLADRDAHDWMSIRGDAPWGNEDIASVSLLANPYVSNHQVWAVIAAGTEVYFRGNIFGDAPWEPISGNKPWGHNSVEQVSISGEGIVVKAGGIVYGSRRSTYELRSPAAMWLRKDWKAMDMLDQKGTFKNPVPIQADRIASLELLSSGGTIYRTHSSFSPSQGMWKWRDISARQPWGGERIADVAFSFIPLRKLHALSTSYIVAAGNALYRYEGEGSYVDGPRIAQRAGWVRVPGDAPWAADCAATDLNADLAVSISGPATVTRLKGKGEAPLTITVTNNGSTTANGAQFVLPLDLAGLASPRGSVLDGGQLECRKDIHQRIFVCRLGSIQAGASRLFQVLFKVRLSNDNATNQCAAGDTSVTGTVSSGVNDFDVSDNVATVHMHLSCDVPSCSDGNDNDGNGLLDASDPACRPNGFYDARSFGEAERAAVPMNEEVISPADSADEAQPINLW